MKKGTLYLLPTTLGSFATIQKTIPAYNMDVIHELDYFIVENLRTARRFLRAADHPKAIDELRFFELGKHTPEEAVQSFLNPVLEGKDIGLLSEAGTPCVADPGADIVNIAHQLKVEVVPLVGPNSLILALMASGFNGQNFVFHGYLPVDKGELKRKVFSMEQAIYTQNQTQIFIETPFRNKKLFDSLISFCMKQTKLCIASDLTLETENVATHTIAGWKKETADLHKKPAVFLLFH
jgi:16S rRNA (cytidine1402-2'-O)-methyltransferase